MAPDSSVYSKQRSVVAFVIEYKYKNKSLHPYSYNPATEGASKEEDEKN